MRETQLRLQDMLEAIERIEKYAAGGRAEFERNELIQNWFIRHLQIIGESAYKLPPDFRQLHPEIAWTEIIGMRHILVHDYFKINLDIVWVVVEKELPPLKGQVRMILGLPQDHKTSD